jgi:hypothetical protein
MTPLTCRALATLSAGSGRIPALLYTTAFAAALALTPATFSVDDFALQTKAALAHGGGGGGAGGGSGGSGAGGAGAAGGNHGGSEASHSGADPDQGHAEGQVDHQGKGSVASGLGSLNASHASSQALAHAAPNSRVGHIAAYASAIKSLEAAPPHSRAAARAISRAAQSIALASNKTVMPATVQAVDARLGLTVSKAEAIAIANQANVDRAGR